MNVHIFYNYSILENGIEIKSFSLAHVDGYRTVIPTPKTGSNLICRNDYLLSNLFNNDIKELNNYIRMAEFCIE